MARMVAALQYFRMGKEDNWGEGKGGTEAWTGIAPEEFEFGLKADVADAREFVGSFQRKWAGTTGLNLRGRMKMEITPANAQLLLGWACNRTNGELTSYEIQRYTGQEYLSYTGVKVNRASIEASVDSAELMIDVDLIGKGEAVCGSFDAPDVEAGSPFGLSEATVYFGEDDASYFAEGECRRVRIRIDNNLRAGRHGEGYLIQWLDAGAERVEVLVGARLARSTYRDWLRGTKQDMAFKVVFGHAGTGTSLTIELPCVVVRSVGYAGRGAELIDVVIEGEAWKAGSKDVIVVV